MTGTEIIAWLLSGDVSVQYQTYRDLLDEEKPALQKRISTEGWGKQFLSRQHPDGHWGQAFYQPKWTSSNYTLLDLKNLGISSQNQAIRNAIDNILRNERAPDGGIRPIGVYRRSDMCINGMVMNYACYFKAAERFLTSIVDLMLKEQMSDGGFNCQKHHHGTHHSSVHTTLTVIEGILEYKRNGYTYRLAELEKVVADSHKFLLKHHLFRSDKTGEVISPGFLKFCYPYRWHYDILRALDYFRNAKAAYDPGMEDAIQILLKKRTAEGLWKLPAHYPGQTHFDMEKAANPSRWNTLRALRVLKHFGVN